MRDIISEVIHDYFSNRKMLKEYKNLKDAETLRVCGNMLQDMYDNIIKNGVSKHEYTVEKLNMIIGEIRRLQTQFSM